MSYEAAIQSLSNPSFSEIRTIASKQIAHLSESERKKLRDELNRGTALLQTHEHLCQYLYSFGPMHQAKLSDVFDKLPISAFENDVEVVDWGCGQAMGTVNLLDFLRPKNLSQRIKKITLIEPSEFALKRGELHVSAYNYTNTEVATVSKFFEDVTVEDIKSRSGRVVIHIFSNILDVAQIDLRHLANLVDSAVSTDNYLVCVGPLNPTNHRLDAFFRYFDSELIQNIYQYETLNLNDRGWTYKAKVYKLEKNQTGHLIPIEYYPTVQLHAAFESDIIKEFRRQNDEPPFDKLTHFEVAAPFDLGASVYDDVHPILAVLNNIITRGLPTRTSPFIEERLKEAFGLTVRNIKLGEISYQLREEFSGLNCKELFLTYLDSEKEISDDDKLWLQVLLAPVAAARFQKVLLEAIITGHLPMKQKEWKILVEEKDIPFAKIGLEDFVSSFNHLIGLSSDYQGFTLPEIDLVVVNKSAFKSSRLHEDQVVIEVPDSIRTQEFDMVLTQAILQSVSQEIESFSEFRAKNNCYFNIRSISQKRTSRTVYTSSLVKYRNLVNRSPQGQYIEVDDTKEHLTYFLQLLFRKEAFRPGQLPILDRALQNLPVIGLLPTGGGKSLTYQIAALLQPGVTMVIDPLKSLMKDQYDGLIQNGIDCAAFINSALTSQEKRNRERQLEYSQLLFVFLSPERLSIATFRERLKNMHEYNVYFSYGVIDEVHCVSEWGHDFRFSYLHLGRNLYNYARARDKEISLFGLTATASFDVLADVERELSGNGAFELDADVIVRYENTNRLELQYKVEKVPVDFEVDAYYDRYNKLAAHLPKAVNINKTNRTVFDSKSDFLKGYVKKVPTYVRELQSDEAIDHIKKRFIERQSNDIGVEADLTVDMKDDYYSSGPEYIAAGIVFCPHVASTGLSVEKNTENMMFAGIEDTASFSGRDDDNKSMYSLESFKNNQSPLMVATKAFGMGIDKPNVRYTVNMNYSSSLEAFVQEAGRAGRDKKMALATILLSDYTLVQVSRSYPSTEFPLSIIKNKWFKSEDLQAILNYYDVEVPEEFLLYATPENDIVKLHCRKDNRMFAFNECGNSCSEYKRCTLRKVTPESKGWKTEAELIQELRTQGLSISKKSFQYLNADYQTVMYFFNESFKGDAIEKLYMHKLLNIQQVFVRDDMTSGGGTVSKGFLMPLLASGTGDELVVFVPYNEAELADLSKAIYRMTCIELVEDFTQDYVKRQFRIVTRKKAVGEYLEGLKRFLLRYYTPDRAENELLKVQSIAINVQTDVLSEEIYRCLSYMTEFVYDKISEKRKRAIDDIRNFCLQGVATGVSWLENNENLKDFIFYYFNSKYAKSDYVADNGEPYSLVEDTEGGKKSSIEILSKYMRVVDDEIVGVGTPLDNVKHLYGAVRLISRSLTDSNPALYLLEVFCLAYMGTKDNQNLITQLTLRYSEGMADLSLRHEHNQQEFWSVFESFNKVLSSYLHEDDLNTLIEETTLLIHAGYFQSIKNKYLEAYE